MACDAFEVLFEFDDSAGLDEVVVGVKAEGLDGGVEVGVFREDDNGGFVAAGGDFMEEVEGIAIGEMEVEEDDIEGTAGEFCAGFFDGMGEGCFAEAVEFRGPEACEGIFILDDQEAQAVCVFIRLAACCGSAVLASRGGG